MAAPLMQGQVEAFHVMMEKMIESKSAEIYKIVQENQVLKEESVGSPGIRRPKSESSFEDPDEVGAKSEESFELTKTGKKAYAL